MRISDCHTLLSATSALLLAGCAISAQQRPGHALIRSIDSVARAALRAGPIAGMSVALVRGSDVLLAKGYGYADLENSVPATQHTVYRIASITKQFTAAAILQLAEQGQLNLDDDIRRYLPSYDTQSYTITIRQLLNHTSGIRSFTELPAFQARDRLDLPAESLLAIFQHEPLDFPPGAGFRYNNSAFYLLGLIIERVSRQPYGEYLRGHVLAPLGLRETYSCRDAPIIRHRARGYRLSGGKLQNAQYLSMEPPTAGGSLCSTVLDLVTWTRALAEGRLITHASYLQMTTPGTLPDGITLGYGHGLFVSTLGGHREIVHGGDINGFSAYKAYYPDDSLTLVILSNTEGPLVSSGQIPRAIARRALGVPEERPKELPLSTRDRARFTGVYRAGTARVAVTEERGQITLTEPFPAAYLYQGGDVFVCDKSAEIRALFSGRGARADRLILELGGQRLFDLTRAP
ncbi:MAG TPA: serine hydrolase domain-containing protein [Gemmatimonadales bacterium]|nr:serine hydrolase domain-containing protein [Gemmatimonadales bacterium]